MKVKFGNKPAFRIGSRIYWLKPTKSPPSWWQAVKPLHLKSSFSNRQSAIRPGTARDGAARDRKIVKIEYNITDTRFVMSRRGAEEAAGGRRLICEQRESLRMGRRIIT
jgi:hypothetical protein